MNKLLYFLTNWLRVYVIHVGDRPYLERYHLGEAFGLTFYLHRFVREDGERWIHDHPWPWALAIVLCGGYTEERWRYLCPVAGLVTCERKVRWWNLLRASTFHRIASIKPNTWTLLIRPGRSKDWGFVEPAVRFTGDEPLYLVYSNPFEGERTADFMQDVPTGREYRRQSGEDPAQLVREALDLRFTYYNEGDRQ